MAEAVLVPIVASMALAALKPVLTKCGDALLKTDTAAGLMSALLGNLKPKLEELQRELTKLDGLLSGAEMLTPEQLTRNALLSPWLQRVKGAAIYADNLLEDISYDQLRRQAESNSMVSHLFRASDGTSITFRKKIGSQLSKFKSMAAEIYKEAAQIGIQPAQFVANPGSYQLPADTSTDKLTEIRKNADRDIVVGRQLDEDSIVQELCRTENINKEALGVIAMVGMSGVGKTTLARKIYYRNDIVKTIYTKKSWIFVSHDFNLTRLLNEMLQSLTGDNHSMTNTDAMENKLHDCLQKESYLLVLDDVWNKNEQIWDSIRSSLVRVTDGCISSKVLVTTQSFEVASIMGVYLTHKLQVLSDDDAWTLFEGKAFENKSEQQVLELRAVGKRILGKCGGLPLAINTLASLLASMEKRSEWESIERNEVWKLSEGQTKVMPWLLLSFNHLPSAAIKQCFAHCSSVFRKRQSFAAEFLIEFWIAQGFMQPSEPRDDSTLGDIGRMYIKSMVANNLLQSIENKFTMHDLVHDLALYVSMGSRLVIIGDSNDLPKASAVVEHASIFVAGNICNSLLKIGNTRSTLRTLYCIYPTISIDLVAQARFLRQLHLIGCGLKKIPSSIGGLKHLRILDLNGNPFEYLPATIGRLYNLHILDLQRCDGLVELPQQVTKLANLSRIATTEAVHMPKGIGQLTRLTQLPVVKLKAQDGFKITELGSLLHLRNTVNIYGLENIGSKEEAEGADLKNKERIRCLILTWTSEMHEEDRDCCGDEGVMEGLQPHSNLSGLMVENFYGKRFSPWMSDGLYYKNLTSLGLFNCKRCEQLPTLGCLPLLKCLYILKMESVEVIESNFFACSSTGSNHNNISQRKLFPSLEKFQLFRMPKLKEVFDPSGSCAEAFPCLEELSIENCPLLVKLPTCFPSLKELAVHGMNSGEPLLMILSNSNKLTSLIVSNVKQLTCLSEPLLKCTSLQILKIINCNELVELPPTLQRLGCLKTLKVSECDSLKSLPDIEGLLSLTKLDISSCINITNTPRGLESCVSIEDLELIICPKLNLIPDLASLAQLRYLNVVCFQEQMSIPRWTNQLSSLTRMTIGMFNWELDDFDGIDHLPKCLKVLTLIGWKRLKSLPNELQYLAQLERLGLRFFDMAELPEWLSNLSSLQVLEIRNWANLKNLPSSDAMRRLTRLRELTISKCPKLEESCRKGGKEWHKISHLPIIRFTDEVDKIDDRFSLLRWNSKGR